MAINATHPDYDAALPAWSRARDVLAGEDAVKAVGEKYLPRLDSQSDEEYAAYKVRASFFGATARTLEEYVELVFRRAPTFAGIGDRLKAFTDACDASKEQFVGYAARVLREVLSVGRAGTLVLPDGSGRSAVSLWRTEEILDWQVERMGGREVLTGLTLRDGGRVRVLRMADGECVMEVWCGKDEKDLKDEKENSPSAIANSQGGRWELVERAALKRDGEAAPWIPFVFHGARSSGAEVGRLPLADIIAANLDHYRLDADYKHGLHFAALPTAWVSGFDKAAPLRIGSSTAWVSEVPGASAGFLEFSGAGLGHIEKAMEKVERRMAMLGARMVEGSAVESGAGGALSGLGSIVASLNESLSRVLRMAQWWIEGGEVDAKNAAFAMNTDLGARAMSGEEITAVVAAWRAGAISRDTMLERLKRGEVLPDTRSVAQERQLIHGKARAEA